MLVSRLRCDSVMLGRDTKTLTIQMRAAPLGLAYSWDQRPHADLLCDFCGERPKTPGFLLEAGSLEPSMTYSVGYEHC